MSSFDGKKVVVIAAIVFGAVQAGLAGVAHFSCENLQQQIAAERDLLEELEQSFEEAQRDGKPVERTSVAPTWELLDGPGVVTTLQQLQVIGDELGVTFDVQKAVRSAEKGKQSFQLNGHATSAQVAGFVAALERSERLMILETGRLLPAGGDQITFELGLATYHTEEQR